MSCFLTVDSYQLFPGISMACIVVPASTYLVMYFRKYQTVALSLSTSSPALMLLCGPPVITTLVENYGWRNANLVCAAACLQVGILPFFNVSLPSWYIPIADIQQLPLCIRSLSVAERGAAAGRVRCIWLDNH